MEKEMKTQADTLVCLDDPVDTSEANSKDKMTAEIALLLKQLDIFAGQIFVFRAKITSLLSGDEDAVARDVPLVYLLQPVDSLEISWQIRLFLRRENIAYIGDLVQRTEAELLKNPHLGRRMLQDIKDALGMRGLTLGMKLDNWSP